MQTLGSSLAPPSWDKPSNTGRSIVKFCVMVDTDDISSLFNFGENWVTLSYPQCFMDGFQTSQHYTEPRLVKQLWSSPVIT